MRRQSFGLATAILAVGVCGGQPPKSPDAAPEPFSGKVAPPVAPPARPGVQAADRGLVLVADDGTARPLVEDVGSKMLFLDNRLWNRPVRLTALPVPGSKSLRVVCVQTVKDGQAYDVDYWCEICQISLLQPGACVCCGDETELRERPAR